MNRKGFTLVELIAVIIIIGIIGLIVTPIITNVIKETKIKTGTESVLTYVEAVEKQILEEEASDSTNIFAGVWTLEELKDFGLEVNGKFDSSSIYIGENNTVLSGSFCVSGIPINYYDGEAHYDEESDNCDIKPMNPNLEVAKIETYGDNESSLILTPSGELYYKYITEDSAVLIAPGTKFVDIKSSHYYGLALDQNDYLWEIDYSTLQSRKVSNDIKFKKFSSLEGRNIAIDINNNLYYWRASSMPVKAILSAPVDDLYTPKKFEIDKKVIDAQFVSVYDSQPFICLTDENNKLYIMYLGALDHYALTPFLEEFEIEKIKFDNYGGFIALSLNNDLIMGYEYSYEIINKNVEIVDIDALHSPKLIDVDGNVWILDEETYAAREEANEIAYIDGFFNLNRDLYEFANSDEINEVVDMLQEQYDMMVEYEAPSEMIDYTHNMYLTYINLKEIASTMKFTYISGGEYIDFFVSDDNHLFSHHKYNSNELYITPMLINKYTFKDISVGSSHYLALDQNGYLWATGNNSYGQLGVTQKEFTGDPIVDIANFGMLSSLEPATHRIANHNENSSTSILGDLDSEKKFTPSLMLNPAAQKIGTSKYIESAVTPVLVSKDIRFKDMAASYESSVGIDIDGNLWYWGFDEVYTPTKVKTNVKFSKVDVTEDYYVLLDEKGNLWDFGYDYYEDEINYTPRKLTTDGTYTDVSVGLNHIIALDNLGNIWGMGDNTFGQLAMKLDDTSIDYTEIELYDYDYYYHEYSDNYCDYNYCESEYYVPKFTKIDTGDIKFKSIDAGYFHNVAISTDGDLYTWGSDYYGELGDYMNTPAYEIVHILDGERFANVSADYRSTAALGINGKIYVFGAISDSIYLIPVNDDYYYYYYYDSDAFPPSIYVSENNYKKVSLLRGLLFLINSYGNIDISNRKS